MPGIPSGEEALEFEATCFGRMRSLIDGQHQSERTTRAPVQSIGLAGWPPDTEFVVTFVVGDRALERRYRVWDEIWGPIGEVSPDDIAGSIFYGSDVDYAMWTGDV
jgi:hypothetical protein